MSAAVVRTPARARRAGMVLAAAVLGLGVFAGAPAAQAHNYVVSTNPEADSTLTEQPGKIAVTTNDNLLSTGEQNGANAMTITGPNGEFYGDGCVAVTGPAMIMEAQLGAPGHYTVTWQVVSTDGHPVSDEFGFEWQPAADQELAVGVPQRPMCGVAAGGESPSVSTPAATPGEDSSAAPSTTAPSGITADLGWILGAIGVILAGGLVMLVLLLRQRRRADVEREAASPGDTPGTTGA